MLALIKETNCVDKSHFFLQLTFYIRVRKWKSAMFWLHTKLVIDDQHYLHFTLACFFVFIFKLSDNRFNINFQLKCLTARCMFWIISQRLINVVHVVFILTQCNVSRCRPWCYFSRHRFYENLDCPSRFQVIVILELPKLRLISQPGNRWLLKPPNHGNLVLIKLAEIKK